MKLLSPLYESWLFEATQGGLPAWRRSLLARALRRDEKLRCLAYELAEFNCGPAPEGPAVPDFVPGLRARIAVETGPAEEPPLFPSAWLPAGAIAVLLITGWVALAVHPSSDANRGAEASSGPASQAIEALAPPSSQPALASVQPSLGGIRPSAAAPAAAALSKTAATARPSMAPAR